MKIDVSWSLTPCSLAKTHRVFGVFGCLHHQGPKILKRKVNIQYILLGTLQITVLVSNPLAVKFSAPIQTSPVANSASCAISCGYFSPK